jgi:protoheme IX farnesyltransferase
MAQGRLLVLFTTAHAAIGSLTLVAALSLTLWLGRLSTNHCCTLNSPLAASQLTLHPVRETAIFLIDFWHLMRPRIVALVLLAMAVSAWTTTTARPTWLHLANVLCATALVIVGAIALNQRLECAGDAKMPRTADRPLPSGRLSRRQVTTFGLAATVLGLVYLAIAAAPILIVLAAIGWLAYVGIYTPLKSRSAWQTPIGAAAGAMPVLLGAAAAGQSLSPWAWTLFGIVFCWQFPHSMAIAWRYRREFAAAGVKVATVTDPTGRTAGLLAVLGAAALLPVSLIPLQLGLAGTAYGVTVLGLDMIYLAAAVLFARSRDDKTARRLLIVSLIYLPAMLAVVLGSAVACSGV